MSTVLLSKEQNLCLEEIQVKEEKSVQNSISFLPAEAMLIFKVDIAEMV